MNKKPEFRTPNVIAGEIIQHLHNRYLGLTQPPYVIASMVYLKPLLQISSWDGYYGAETAIGIAAYALSNLSRWSGIEARRAKAELRKILDHYNQQGNF